MANEFMFPKKRHIFNVQFHFNVLCNKKIQPCDYKLLNMLRTNFLKCGIFIILTICHSSVAVVKSIVVIFAQKNFLLVWRNIVLNMNYRNNLPVNTINNTYLYQFTMAVN